MIRQTSIDCYNEIKENGLLTEIRLKVLENVMKLAPCTSTELNKHMLEVYNINGSWRVLTHLRDVGVLYETGTRPCKITGRNVIEWDLTNDLPKVELERKQTPRSLRRSVNYITDKMNKDGLMFIDSTYLEKLIS